MALERPPCAVDDIIGIIRWECNWREANARTCIALLEEAVDQIVDREISKATDGLDAQLQPCCVAQDDLHRLANEEGTAKREHCNKCRHRSSGLGEEERKVRPL